MLFGWLIVGLGMAQDLSYNYSNTYMSVNGSQFDGNIRITYFGPYSIGGFSVAVLIDEDGNFNSGAQLLGTEYVPGLFSGGEYNVWFNFDLDDFNISEGCYYVGFFIDYYNSVWETNENNNYNYWSNQPCYYERPYADFSMDLASECQVPATVQLQDYSVGTISSYSWSASGASFSNSSAPSTTATFNSPGTYTITLTVTNPAGDSDSFSEEITISATPSVQVANTTPATCGEANGSAMINVSGGTPPYDFDWNGLSANGPQANNAPGGTYSVEVTDDNGCSATTTVNVPTTGGQAPVANFSYSSNGNTVAFANNSQHGQSYQWNFGDGNTSAEPNPTHQYAGPGTYQVTLAVTNQCGTQQASQSVTIQSTTSIVADENAPTVRAYPNPAHDRLTIDLASLPVGSVSLRLMNLQGQVLHQETQSHRGTAWQTTLEVSRFPAGIYTVVVQVKDQVIHRKIQIR